MTRSVLLIVITALFSFAPAPALHGLASQDTPTARRTTERDSVLQRERFVYPSDDRNPFRPLGPDAGPAFEDLDLLGIIFAGSSGSVATLIDRASGERYRVRRGDTIGSARVVEIQPDALVFQVTEFGVTRSETLRMKGRAEEPGRSRSR